MTIKISNPRGCPRTWACSSDDGAFLGSIREIVQRNLFVAVQSTVIYFEIELHAFGPYGNVVAEYRGRHRSWSACKQKLALLEESMWREVLRTQTRRPSTVERSSEPPTVSEDAIPT